MSRTLSGMLLVSVTLLAGHGTICHPQWVIYMATRRPAHNTPINMDFCKLFLPASAYFKREKGGTICTNCSEIVAQNCAFVWVGVFWGGLPSLEKIKST